MPELSPVNSNKVGNRDDLAGTISEILDKYLQNNIDDMLPAKVISFDAATNIAEVQPLVQLLQTDGTVVSRGTTFIPVFYYGSGNMSLRFNLVAGDLGWIKASDRDLTNFYEDFEESPPITLRTHSFSDSVFLPDSMRAIAFTAGVRAVMGNDSGTIKTEWFDDKIVHTAPNQILQGNVAVVGDLTVSGDAAISGDASVEGDIDGTGTITGGKVETEAGVSLDDHLHTAGTYQVGPFKVLGNSGTPT